MSCSLIEVDQHNTHTRRNTRQKIRQHNFVHKIRARHRRSRKSHNRKKTPSQSCLLCRGIDWHCVWRTADTHSLRRRNSLLFSSRRRATATTSSVELPLSQRNRLFCTKPPAAGAGRNRGENEEEMKFSRFLVLCISMPPCSLIGDCCCCYWALRRRSNFRTLFTFRITSSNENTNLAVLIPHPSNLHSFTTATNYRHYLLWLWISELKKNHKSTLLLLLTTRQEKVNEQVGQF